MWEYIWKPVLYFILPLILALQYIVNKKFSFFKDCNIPANEPRFPYILGDMTGMGSTKHFNQCIKEVYLKYKHSDVIAGFYSMVSPLFLITNLDMIKTVLIKDFNSFADRGLYYNEKDDPMAAHLFNIEGERWRFLRNKLSPTFTSGKIKMMFATIEEKGEGLVTLLEKSIQKGPVEIKDVCVRFNCDIIASASFGLENDALKNKDAEILSIAREVFTLEGLRMLKFFFCESFKGLAKFLHLKSLTDNVNNYFMSVVRNTINYRETNKIVRQDFLNILMQLKDKGSVDEENSDGRKFTFNEVAAQAFVFFFAGFETSSTAMSFALFEMAVNQEFQDKVREEVLRIKNAHGGKITYEALNEMHYLNRVFNETLRKHPPSGALVRQASHDYNFPGTTHIIKKGHQIVIPVHAIHHDPEIYPDPEKFDPDRFLPENIEARHNTSFIPFGEGNRNCIGMRFAQVQGKFGLATVLSNFKITLNPKTRLPLMLELSAPLLSPVDGFWMNLERI